MKLSVSNKLNTYFNGSLSDAESKNKQERQKVKSALSIKQIKNKFQFHTENAKVSLKAPGEMLFVDENAVKKEKILFFDVECVDLSFGPNNIPFLIGMGYFIKNDFIVEQVFLESPVDEDSMLSFLDKFWQKFDYIVTYNGKSFDVPLIKSRFRYFQKEYPDHFMRHFDIYHILKRIFPQKRSRLVDYESAVLQIERKDDLPGSLAGQAYFEYQKQNNETLMQKLYKHNETDILSLAALSIKLDAAIKKAFHGKQNNGEKNWALKIYKLKKPIRSPDFIIKNISTKADKDAEDMYYMGLAHKKKKNYLKAYGLFRKSYKMGNSKALADAVLVLYFYLKKHEKALALIEKYLSVEEASVQGKLLMMRGKILNKLKP
ncbi:MAG: ribonuclease H-like domain-containing protein [Spirochaetia bacterium]|nr:ribonuclease H-like domain-containing protein [Spirochaetia bacterium]